MLKKFGYAPIIIIIAFAVVMLYVWQRTQSLRMGYTVSDLRERRDVLMEENATLQLKISSYQSLEKLGEVAKESGLAVPDASQTIYLNGE